MLAGAEPLFLNQTDANGFALDLDSLTAEQWAQRRLDWFVFRDAWIARQRQWAQAHGGD